MAQTPARSILSYRLFLTEHARAGLNLYATHPGVFTDESVATGAVFAAYASMALLAAARQDTANHLLCALETNPRDHHHRHATLAPPPELTNAHSY